MAHAPAARLPRCAGQAASASAGSPLQSHRGGGGSACLRVVAGGAVAVLPCVWGGDGSACLRIAHGRGGSGACLHMAERWGSGSACLRRRWQCLL
eukprot:6581908-Alexandrium_andersonii.AAC.1